MSNVFFHGRTDPAGSPESQRSKPSVINQSHMNIEEDGEVGSNKLKMARNVFSMLAHEPDVYID